MSTAFSDRKFSYCELSAGSLQTDGTYSSGSASMREVSGTIQPMSYSDCIALSDGARTSGYVKVYSNERLCAVERGNGNAGGYVALAEKVFKLVNEQAYVNNVMSHYKYVAVLVEDVPQLVKSAFRNWSGDGDNS